ncbi:hypothetical protein [Iodobacter fluviatilis]|uniref:Capsular polysaccharide biosynthesis protein n=1 Tax=Iodobacter fluviatilis TaxID=537 RepID=A0A377STX5_9NEIS|nr:hypothetical protein [Iodobacter fluviatilis]TCU87983.1 hypothetical protein EV682_104152 [Iodobacter fluviatilis]STR45484.1 Capsular polysaccharide biosynthesis protein [Iodobacter fluviatilis]
MKNNIVFTVVARNYLSLALTLGDSLKEVHPEIEYRIYCSDGLEGINPSEFKHKVFDAIYAVGDDYKNMAFKYNVTEFCTAIKPYIFDALITENNWDKILYLDPDMMVFSDMSYIISALEKKSIFITPHIVDCNIKDMNVYPEYHHLWEGIFNFGFCAIKVDEHSRKFISWWRERLKNHCYVDKHDGLHTDQKWGDYLPVFFSDVIHISKHYGINMAHWNLSERELSINSDGKYCVNEFPLVIFHFSGFDFYGKTLTKHVDGKLQEIYLNKPNLIALADMYRKKVLENGLEAFIKNKYKHSYFNNDVVVLALHRRLYRECFDSIQGIDPFDSNQDFYKKLSENKLLDLSNDGLDGYTKNSISDFDKKKKKIEFFLRLVFRLIGVKKYYLFLKVMGVYSRIEENKFIMKN